jgi:peroxiredoxin family protein
MSDRENRLALVVTSNDLDRVWPALILAVGAAASGMQVSIFWAFWGLTVLRRENPGRVSKPLLNRLFGWMMPRGINQLRLAKLNLAGLGTAMMRSIAKKKNVASPSELLVTARELGVRQIACQMSMDLLGVTRAELIDGLEYGGVAMCLADARDAAIALFI